MAETPKSALLMVHPEYKKYENRWPFWADSSKGGADYEAKDIYLVKHPREADEKGAYEHRKALATYESHGKQVADDWISRLLGPGLDLALASPADADAATIQFANAIASDIDLLGTDLLNFAKKVLYKAITLGSVGVVTDVTPDGIDVETVNQAVKIGLRPYARMFNPWDILDWEFDKQARLNWVKIREKAQIPRNWQEPTGMRIPVQTEIATATAYTQNEAYRYFIIDRTAIRRWEPVNDGRQHEELPPAIHNLEEVPFQMFYGATPDAGCMFQPPLIEEVYSFDHLIYNERSGLVDLMFNQMFSILTVQVMGGQSFDKTHPVGTRRAFGYPIGSGAPPAFISPDARLVEAHLKAIEDCEKAIKRIAKFGGMTSVEDKVREASGRSKAFEADPLTTLLRAVGDTQEPAFRNFLRFLHLRSIFANAPFTGRAKFPDSIVLRGILEEREDTAAACNVMACSETAVRLMIQHFANQVLPSIWSDEERTNVMKEIQGAPLNAMLMMMQPNGGNDVGDGSDTTGASADSGTGRPLQRARRDAEQPGPSVRAA